MNRRTKYKKSGWRKQYREDYLHWKGGGFKAGEWGFSLCYFGDKPYLRAMAEHMQRSGEMFGKILATTVVE